MEEKEIKLHLKACDICALLLRDIKYISIPLMEKGVEDKIRYITMLELKCYYWLLDAFINEVTTNCKELVCKNQLNLVLNELGKLFEQENVLLDTYSRKCDVCRILPCSLFSIMDSLCRTNFSEANKMKLELEYQLILASLNDEIVGRCTDCDEFVEYEACKKFAYEYLLTDDDQRLRQEVFYWKKARNSDEILGQVDALNIDGGIKFENVDLTGKKTVYLDFNVYQDYENDSSVHTFLDKLNEDGEFTFVYSGTHLEEILRMKGQDYIHKRIGSIATLTQGKFVVVGSDKKAVICIQDINQRFHQVRKYIEMNKAAEERECIQAEAREHLALHEKNENRDKAIGSSSLRKMLFNTNKKGNKINSLLPGEDELNKILSYVGIGNKGIREYLDFLSEDEIEYHEIRSAIVSIAELLMIIGLHSDKVEDKNNLESVYPIYHKDSFRKIKSGYYDNDHLSFAVNCDYFVTKDKTLQKKAKEIFDFLGIKTESILLHNFMKIVQEKE